MSQTNSFLSKNRVARGEIFYIVPYGNEAEVGQFVGGRPAIIVSNDMNNEYNGVVEVVYMTREGKCKTNQPTNVPISATGIKSIALCNQIYTVNKKRIGKYVGECSLAEMKAVEKALCVGLCTDSVFNDKNIIDILEAWRNDIRKNPDTIEIENDVSEDFETPDEPEIVVVESDENTDESETEAIVDIEKHPDYIKLLAERDVIKSMYNDLLSKCLKAGVNI